MTPRWTSARVLASIIGVGAFALVGLTAASTVEWGKLVVAIDGTHNTFDLQAAGSDEAGWTPAASSWAHGRPDPIVVVLRDATIGPGRSLSTRVAVRNASPRLGALIALHVVRPVTPNPLFDQLRFTISEAGHVYADNVDATTASTIALTGPTASGASRTLDLTISLPADATDSLEGLRTPVSVRFSGVSE
ncbi:hypothetical protein [Leifsonia lichenia]